MKIARNLAFILSIFLAALYAITWLVQSNFEGFFYSNQDLVDKIMTYSFWGMIVLFILGLLLALIDLFIPEKKSKKRHKKPQNRKPRPKPDESDEDEEKEEDEHDDASTPTQTDGERQGNEDDPESRREEVEEDATDSGKPDHASSPRQVDSENEISLDDNIDDSEKESDNLSNESKVDEPTNDIQDTVEPDREELEDPEVDDEIEFTQQGFSKFESEGKHYGFKNDGGIVTIKYPQTRLKHDK